MNDYVPLTYALLPNKGDGTYERFFRAVKTLAPAGHSRNGLTDIELAALNTLTTVFQTPNNDLTSQWLCFHLETVQSEEKRASFTQQ